MCKQRNNSAISLKFVAHYTLRNLKVQFYKYSLTLIFSLNNVLRLNIESILNVLVNVRKTIVSVSK